MALLTGLALALAARASAQQPLAPDSDDSGRSAGVQVLTFLAGAGVALVAHETGHLVFDLGFDARPRLEGVRFGPFPFFALTPRPDLSPRREFAIASAGFWVQEGTDEWLLTARPRLRDERAWFAKGVLAFNLLASIGYAAVAFAKAGPPQRDTRGMASALGIDERMIGVVVLAPAALDAYRYFRPDSTLARWLSRASKAGGVVVMVK